MAQTPSNMLPLGTIAPAFELVDAVTNETVSLSSEKGLNGTVIIFTSNHCPFVKHINPKLAELAKVYKPKGVAFMAIGSNAIENYPQDAPEFMKKVAIAEDFIFPYLYDPTQAVAKAYDAACTPDFYLFDRQLKLVYRGQLDGSRPGNNIPVTGEDLTNALDALLKGLPISNNQKPSLGCNIKWRS